jgi:hypothetical protein
MKPFLSRAIVRTRRSFALRSRARDHPTARNFVARWSNWCTAARRRKAGTSIERCWRVLGQDVHKSKQLAILLGGCVTRARDLAKRRVPGDRPLFVCGAADVRESARTPALKLSKAWDLNSARCSYLVKQRGQAVYRITITVGYWWLCLLRRDIFSARL